jgi:hypothetical protein
MKLPRGMNNVSKGFSSKLDSFRLSRSDYTVSFFGQLALAGTGMLYLFSETWDPAAMTSFIVMTGILLMGIIFTIVFVGMPKFILFNTKSLIADAVSTAGSFVAVYAINRAVPANIGMGVSPLTETEFGILSGVSEEWFFRSWLCCWIYKVTHSMFLAVAISSPVWAWFHLARYGGNMNLIWLITLCGVPLGVFTLMFRSADGPSFGHMIINALARS